MSSSSVNLRLTRPGSLKTLIRFSPAATRIQTAFVSLPCGRFYCSLKFSRSEVQRHGCNLMHKLVRIRSMEEASEGMSSFDVWGDSDGISGDDSYILTSSGEESDTELVINPIGDVDLPSIKEHFDSSDGALAVTAHRFAMLRKRQKTNRIQPGVLINMGLIVFLMVLLLLVDWCSWRLVRLPLVPFYLTRPFLMSASLTSFAGYVCVPLFGSLRIVQIIKKRSVMHSSKKRTPTMGGLFFIPIGVTVARFMAGFSSVEVFGAAAATLAFAVIGLLDDIFSFIKNYKYGLPAWIKVLLEVAVGTWFSFWLYSTNISSPYSMKMLVPLPAALGLVYLGKFYPFLTTFCFVSMGNGIDLADGLDGLAGGTAALAFIGMSIAVLPICPDLSIFGASMAGACVGFLLHNQYKASIFMGDIGSLALGGALAAMAACTGMFFPLFLSSGILVFEALSIIMQVFYYKTTKWLYGGDRCLFRIVPLHRQLELCGFKEPLIVTSAYVLSCILAVFAGYVGLVSA